MSFILKMAIVKIILRNKMLSLLAVVIISGTLASEKPDTFSQGNLGLHGSSVSSDFGLGKYDTASLKRSLGSAKDEAKMTMNNLSHSDSFVDSLNVITSDLGRWLGSAASSLQELAVDSYEWLVVAFSSP